MNSITGSVMDRIKKKEIRMKPHWYFLAGSILLVVGIAAALAISVFLVSLTVFSLRTHGPMVQLRLNQLLATFPWWAPLIALLGIGAGIGLLRRYDFSYRKNFLLIAGGLILVVVLVGWFIDYSGLDDFWMGGRMMRGIYQQYDGGSGPGPGQGPGRGMMRGGMGRSIQSQSKQ